MEHTITEFKEWPKGLEVSYHDWIVLGSKTEIMKKLGFKPVYKRTGKCKYSWKCNLDDGKYYFTIYDMSYDNKLGKDDITEYHIGFDCNYDDINDFWPNTLEALDMLEALNERGLVCKHSDTWEMIHKSGLLAEIEAEITKNLKNGRY